MRNILLSQPHKQISLLKIFLSLIALFICFTYTNGQNQTAKVTPGGTWYYEYLPPDYNSNTNNYPIMFFLHGLGEAGNTEADLSRVASNGPPKHVKNGFKFPFILISPQAKKPPTGNGNASWSSKVIDAVIEHCINNLRADKSRIYITGLSLGGGGTWGYIQDAVLNQKIAASAVMCGHQNNPAKACNIVNSGIPVWAFHGDADKTVNVNKTVNMVMAINACDPAPNPLALITIYPGVGHNCWDNAYRTDNSLHKPNVYEWLLQYKNGGVKVNVGADFSLSLPSNSTNIVGSATTDAGSIISYQWTKESGPAATITNASSPTVSLTNLIAGVYTFRLTASNGTETSYDDVNVTVVSINQTPVADAGSDKGMTLPTNAINIVGKGTDTDGTITKYLWKMVSGPIAIANQNTATLSLSGLIAGTYVFSLTVTDNNLPLGATATDNVTVTVSPAIVNQAPTADAGIDKDLYLPTNTLNLTGLGSDADGTIASYLWEKVSGPTVTFANADKPTVSLSALVAGNYVFQLTVKDDKAAVGTDKVSVTVIAANQSPTASAGIDIKLTLPTNSTNIVGSASDPDGSIKIPNGYIWTQVSGPNTAVLQNDSSSTLSCKSLIEGIYTFRLTVTDNNLPLGATAIDDVNVTVYSAPVNNPPVANAGIDRVIKLTTLPKPPNNFTTFDGTGNDSDGTLSPVGYSWIKISGPSYTPTNENTASLTASDLVEGTYVFQFTVTDDKGAKDTDDVTLTVQPVAVNSAPVASAGTKVVITAPIDNTSLTASATDSDGTIVSYSWIKLSGPSATLSGESTNILQVTNMLLPGDYIFQVTVTDDGNATDTDEVTVTVNAANVAPTANARFDIFITSPASSTLISGSGNDVDGTIVSYAWSYVSGGPGPLPTFANENTSDVTVSDLLVGTYIFRLTVTDDDTATGTDDVKVIVNAPANQSPTANAGIDKAITLPTSSENFTGMGKDLDGTIASYLWTVVSKPPTATVPPLTNETTPTVTVSAITVPGTYVFNLEVTDNNSASGSDQVSLIVNPIVAANKPPTVSAGSNQSIQLPINSTNLNGTASDVDGSIASYKWTFVSGPSTIVPTNNDKPTATVSGLLAGTYKFRLTVKDDKGLSASATVSIFVSPATINQPPVANAGNDQILTPIPPNDLTTPLSTTIFGSGSDPDGNLKNPPAVVTYLWSQLPGGPTIINPANITGATTATLSFTDILQAGDYVFQLTVSDGLASASDNVTIKVNTATANIIPIVNAGPDQLITLPTNILTLNGSGSDADAKPNPILSYLWSKLSGPSVTLVGLTQPKLQLSNLVEGQYTFRLEVSDGKDSNTDDVIVNVDPATLNQSPTVNIEFINPIFLPINRTTLSGDASDNDGTIISYLWTKTSGPAATLVNIATKTLTLNNLVEGVYIFRLTATDNDNATDFAEVQVTVKALGANQPPTVNGGSDQTFKKPQDNTQLSAMGFDPEGASLTYNWEKITGPSCTLAGTNPLAISNMQEGFYQFKITVTDDQGAPAIDLVNITVLPLSINQSPVVSAGDDVSIQLPENTATLTGTVTDDGTTTVSWIQTSGAAATLSPNGNTLVVSNLVEGTYTFKFTAVDNGSLSNSDEVSIVVSLPNPPPFVDIIGKSEIELPTNSVTLTALADSPNGLIQSYKWKLEFGNPLDLTTDTTAVFEVTNMTLGTYKFSITVRDELNQEAVKEFTVNVLDGPSNSFSPNNDGAFDTWTIGERFTIDKESDIKVFNRQGLRVFQSTGYEIPWDGTLNGKALPEGVYFYVIREIDKPVKKGSVTLIR